MAELATICVGSIAGHERGWRLIYPRFVGLQGSAPSTLVALSRALMGIDGGRSWKSA